MDPTKKNNNRKKNKTGNRYMHYGIDKDVYYPALRDWNVPINEEYNKQREKMYKLMFDKKSTIRPIWKCKVSDEVEQLNLIEVGNNQPETYPESDKELLKKAYPKIDFEKLDIMNKINFEDLNNMNELNIEITNKLLLKKFNNDTNLKQTKSNENNFTLISNLEALNLEKYKNKSKFDHVFSNEFNNLFDKKNCLKRCGTDIENGIEIKERKKSLPSLKSLEKQIEQNRLLPEYHKRKMLSKPHTKLHHLSPYRHFTNFLDNCSLETHDTKNTATPGKHSYMKSPIKPNTKNYPSEDILRYSKALQYNLEILNPPLEEGEPLNEMEESILKYKDKKKPTPERISSSGYMTKNCLNVMKKKPNIRRNLPDSSSKTLDAPGLNAEFCSHMLDWSVKNTIAVVLSNDIYFWNAETNIVDKFNIKKNVGSVKIMAVKWSEDGEILAVGMDKGLQFWSTDPQILIGQIKPYDEITVMDWNRSLLAVGTKKGHIDIIDTRLVICWKGKNVSCTYSHTRTFVQEILSNQCSQSLKLKGQCHYQDILYPYTKTVQSRHKSIVRHYIHHTDSICSIEWSPDRNYFASGSLDKTAAVWSFSASDYKNILKGWKDLSDENIENAKNVDICNEYSCYCNNNNPQLKLEFYNFLKEMGSNWKPIHVYTQTTNFVRSVSWSPHFYCLLNVTDTDGNIFVFDTNMSKLMKHKKTESPIYNLIWNPFQNEFITVNGSNHNLTLWNFNNFDVLGRLTGHKDAPLCSALSPLGELVVTASNDETLRFWKMFSSKQRIKEKHSPLKLSYALR
ncbi:hypothetical protein A3Q56_03226 [Intoshia linei]|uniref:Uncharacterized protein n=1 Tax=Intoshia linei TaxID=1819745 RepID=A0A177B6I0_9BILA|nr:hypothetical protein A3Q56_03226 [Intoshia linei]